jgi:hypothetical protein
MICPQRDSMGRSAEGSGQRSQTWRLWSCPTSGWYGSSSGDSFSRSSVSHAVRCGVCLLPVAAGHAPESTTGVVVSWTTHDLLSLGWCRWHEYHCPQEVTNGALGHVLGGLGFQLVPFGSRLARGRMRAGAALLLPSGRLPSARFPPPWPATAPGTARGPVKRDQTAGPKSLSGPAGGFYGETVATAGPGR